MKRAVWSSSKNERDITRGRDGKIEVQRKRTYNARWSYGERQTRKEAVEVCQQGSCWVYICRAAGER